GIKALESIPLLYSVDHHRDTNQRKDDQHENRHDAAKLKHGDIVTSPFSSRLGNHAPYSVPSHRPSPRKAHELSFEKAIPLATLSQKMRGGRVRQVSSNAGMVYR